MKKSLIAFVEVLLGLGVLFFLLKDFQSTKTSLSLQKETPNSIQKAMHTITPTDYPYPTYAQVSPANFKKLYEVWRLGSTQFRDSQTPIHFTYPSYFDKQSCSNTNLCLRFYTPFVDHRNTSMTNEDWNTYEDNMMQIIIEMNKNSDQYTQNNYLYHLYNTEIQNNAITNKDIQKLSFPVPHSFMYTDSTSENPNKSLLFDYRDNFYIFTLIGGTQTGMKYSTDAESVFNRVITSISFN